MEKTPPEAEKFRLKTKDQRRRTYLGRFCSACLAESLGCSGRSRNEFSAECFDTHLFLGYREYKLQGIKFYNRDCKDSPAQKAGLKTGDQIVSINGEKLQVPPASFNNKQHLGEKLKLTILQKIR